MSKRKLNTKNKKIRIAAIGSALATGGVIVALPPSADAADEKTPEQITGMCHMSAKINGEQRSTADFGGGLGDGFAADTCDFVETKFETFDGPRGKVTVDFPNCEPNATDPAKVNVEWSTTVTQGEGKYTVTQQGGGGGILGFLTGSWLKHRATMDMAIDSATASESEEREVPVGKVLHMEFTPKMQRMTGVWKVHSDAREATTVANPVPEVNLDAEEVVEGPSILESAAGGANVTDVEIPQATVPRTRFPARSPRTRRSPPCSTVAWNRATTPSLPTARTPPSASASTPRSGSWRWATTLPPSPSTMASALPPDAWLGWRAAYAAS